jgi:hypothetical protein
MGRRKAADGDDDDDDYVPRVGRPPSPEAFGPPRPEPQDRKEYASRLQALLDAIEIQDLGRDERRYLQRILWRSDRLESVDRKRFPNQGTENVTHLLRLVFESSNGSAALKLPILRAVSDCMHPVWIGKGLAFIEALDHVDLVGLHNTLRDMGIEDQLTRALRKKLEAILGPPVEPKPSKPVKPAKVKRMPKKPPTKITRGRPPNSRPPQAKPAARIAA